MLTALAGILLGNLLIATLFGPALKELRQILMKFERIALPYRPLFDDKNASATDRQDAAEKAATKFNVLFRQYSMSFGAFKKVGLVFTAGIVGLGWLTISRLPVPNSFRILGAIGFAACIAAIGRFLQRAIAPTPSEMVEIDFLQNNFSNFHLSSLFDTARIRIDPSRGVRDPVMHFQIHQELMFVGYRFLAVVSDPECSRVFFAAYGHIDHKTDFDQMLGPEFQYFSTRIGDFSMRDAMTVSELLTLNCWLFIPNPRGWTSSEKLCPRFAVHELTDDKIGRVGINYRPTRFSWSSIDESVEFERRWKAGSEFWTINQVQAAPSSSPQRILAMYKDRVMNCRTIESHDHPAGITVRYLTPS